MRESATHMARGFEIRPITPSHIMPPLRSAADCKSAFRLDASKFDLCKNPREKERCT
jgi:hypothetical protein